VGISSLLILLQLLGGGLNFFVWLFSFKYSEERRIILIREEFGVIERRDGSRGNEKRFPSL